MPRQYLVPYVVSNVIALCLLLLSFRRPQWVRFATVMIFVWAFSVNIRIALFSPGDYQGFSALALVPWYRDFITGWFRMHTALMLVPIALGQLGIGLLLFGSRSLQRLAVSGAVIFLLAIAPLGVGSAFPFSLTYGAALIVMYRKLHPVHHAGSSILDAHPPLPLPARGLAGHADAQRWHWS